jgi:uncharacterized protein involved in exopolysaccharide biosynthesis
MQNGIATVSGSSTTHTTHVLAIPNFTVRAGLEGFFRQKTLFFFVASPVVIATILFTLLTHKQYASEMRFLVQNTRGNVVVTPERTSPTNLVTDVSETQVNSELEVLHSHDVIDPVADPDWVNLPKNQQTPAAVKKHETLLRQFEKRYATEIIRKTNVISVKILADTPEKAKNDLERLSTAYLGEHRRLQRPPGASQFFEGEAERLRKSWDEASRRLVDFQQEHQLISLPQRELTLDGQIGDDERDLQATDTSLHEVDTRLQASGVRIKEIPKRHMTQERELPNQQSVQSLNTLLVELENKRTTLLTNYKSSDRTVHELDLEIATTKSALQDAKASSAKEETTDIDPVWQQVHTDYVRTGIKRQELTAHRASIASQLVEAREKLSELKELTVQFNNLQSQSDELKDNYELYVQKRDQAQIEDAMDEQKLLNVAVAQAPTLAYAPERPKPVTNALLGGVTSLLLGLCAVYFAEMGRSTIATPRELEGVSRYPLLATVPKVSSWVSSLPAGPENGHRRTLAPTITKDTKPFSTALNPREGTPV